MKDLENEPFIFDVIFKRWGLLMLVCFISVFSCKTEQASPEEVVRQYIDQLGKGELETAKALCTPAGAAYLSALREVMVSTDTTITSSPIQIQELNCTLMDSLAHCQSIEYDGFETYPAEYFLRLGSSGWLVDQPVAQGETSTSEEVLEPEEKEGQKN